MKKLKPPALSFKSNGGNEFTLEAGVHQERYKSDPLWDDVWPILYQGKPAGKLFRSLSYGTTSQGEPRWNATTRQLFWTYAEDAPTGIGFDVAAFDTAEQALQAWGRSADQILDWANGKVVPSIYSKTGSYQKVTQAAIPVPPSGSRTE